MQKQNWHNLAAENILEIFDTRENGLSEQEAQQRLKKYGSNKLPESKRVSIWQIIFHQVNNPLIYILLIAGVVALVLSEFINFYVIIASAVVNVFIGFFEENQAERTLEKLKKMINYQARVIRGNEEKIIDIEEVVPGDIVVLNAGDIVPADGRVLDVNNLEVIEAVLTGESAASLKNNQILSPETVLADRENMVYQGTIVTRGKGKIIIVSTGLETEMGKIATFLKNENHEDTPLQKKLGLLARTIGIIILITCLIVFISGLLSGKPFLEMLLIAVAIAAAGVPEGLVIALTVCLTIGMKRILKKRALVRKLVSAETLGSTTVICSDKTGTLTEGKMAVVKLIPSAENEKINLLQSFLFCQNVVIKNEKDKFEDWVIYGNIMEVALVRAAVAAGIEKRELFKKYSKTDEILFESERMYMANLWQERIEGQEKRGWIYAKGAPEKILNFCDLSEQQRKEIEKEQQNLTAQGLTVLAFAQKETNKNEIFEQNLFRMKYLGLVALKDPLRPEARQAIIECQKAGIRPIIITGDHILTAREIGKDLGLIFSDREIIEAKELDELSDQELKKALQRIKIFARVEPRHKIRIINILKQMDEVVAMVGDGVNDAPAIKAANIGIAVGSGSEVAKEASDIVLLDNNFRTIVSAVEEGRIIFDNIKKIIVYLFTDAFAEVVLIGGAIILGWPMPVLVTQILWINIIEDALPAMALAYEKSDGQVLEESPRNHKTSIFDRQMKFIVFMPGMIGNFLLLGLYWFLLDWGIFSFEHVRTLIFVALGINSLFFIFSCKSLKKNIWQYRLFDNLYLDASLLVGFAMFLAALYLPFFQKVLKTVPLNFMEWLILLAIGLIFIFLVESAKFVFRVKQKK